MNVQKTATAAVVAAMMAFGASAASASTVNLEYQVPGNKYGNPNWSESVWVKTNRRGRYYRATPGLYRLRDSDTGADVLAWCIDYFKPMRDHKAYDTAVSFVSDMQLDYIDRLFNSAYESVTDSVTAAGFQLALWEIMADTGNLNLSKGNFRVSDYSYEAKTVAAGYLDGLSTATTGGYDLTTYYSNHSQNLVSGVPSQVPVPASAVLLFSGLFGAGALRRRRKTEA